MACHWLGRFDSFLKDFQRNVLFCVSFQTSIHWKCWIHRFTSENYSISRSDSRFTSKHSCRRQNECDKTKINSRSKTNEKNKTHCLCWCSDWQTTRSRSDVDSKQSRFSFFIGPLFKSSSFASTKKRRRGKRKLSDKFNENLSFTFRTLNTPRCRILLTWFRASRPRWVDLDFLFDKKKTMIAFSQSVSWVLVSAR